MRALRASFAATTRLLARDLALALRIGNPGRPAAILLAIAMGGAVSFALTAATVASGAVGYRMESFDVDRPPTDVSISASPDLPPLPKLEGSRRYRIVDAADAEASVSLSLEKDRLVARIDSRMGSRPVLPDDGDPVGRIVSILRWNWDKERRQFAGATAAFAVKSRWLRDVVDTSGMPTWVSGPTFVRSDGRGKASAGPPGEDDDRESMSNMSLALSFGMAAIPSFLSAFFAVGIVGSLSTERSGGRWEALLPTRAGIGHVVFGALVAKLLLFALGAALVAIVGNRLFGTYAPGYVPVVGQAFAETMRTTYPAIAMCVAVQLPVVWYALMPSRSQVGTALASTVLVGTSTFYLSLPRLVARSEALLDATTGWFPMLGVSRPFLSALASTGVADYLPVASAAHMVAEGRCPPLPFAVSVATGVPIVVVMWRALLGRGRTWFLTSE